jgi:hypothetical protein
MKSFLATVDKVYPTNTDLLKYDGGDAVSIYNGNKSFSDTDARMYGAITYKFEDTISTDDYAHPFDKNNFTFPIKGETVIILKIEEQTFYLPYCITPYSNYRRDYSKYEATKEEDTSETGSDSSAKEKRESAQTGGTTTASDTNKKDNKYNVNEKIKFLKPFEGDTIISGRVSNTIRFSEFFLTEDGKTSSPGIYIRNKQNPELDSKKIGELIDEDINKDGTSIYITSNKVKVPFLETTKKEKKAFTEYPSSSDLKGDQLFVNSDRIILSAKANEFIIFGKKNTGIITDGRFTVDSAKDIYLHTDKVITLHSKGNNKIFLNSDSGGKIYLGKDTGEGGAGAAVQKMVLGGELVKILQDLISAINKQIYATPVGPTPAGPVNRAEFDAIKGRLNTILSARNYLSKS